MNERAVRKLHMKKYRDEAQLFLVEGRANVMELLHSDHPVAELFVTKKLEGDVRTALERSERHMEVTVVTDETLAHMSTLESNDTMLAIAPYFATRDESDAHKVAQSGYVLVLDDVRDPGNFGTILRTADWFGVRTVVVSPTTVDRYNPKVVSASKGSFLRVDIIETPLVPFLTRARELGTHTFGTFLTGTPLHEVTTTGNGLIVLGNEAHGIQKDIETRITTRVTIPKYGDGESLNVGIATGIVLYALHVK